MNKTKKKFNQIPITCFHVWPHGILRTYLKLVEPIKSKSKKRFRERKIEREEVRDWPFLLDLLHVNPGECREIDPKAEHRTRSVCHPHSLSPAPAASAERRSMPTSPDSDSPFLKQNNIHREKKHRDWVFFYKKNDWKQREPTNSDHEIHDPEKMEPLIPTNPSVRTPRKWKQSMGKGGRKGKYLNLGKCDWGRRRDFVSEKREIWEIEREI